MLLAGAAVLLRPGAAHAGLDRYVKKRQLDPLDTYVPLVLEARETLAGLEPVMAADPSAARQQLRSGAFRGMRDNVRALGQYAALPVDGGGSGLGEAAADQLVQGFFRALEDYDLLLYNAVREAKQQAQRAARDAGGEDGGEAAAAAAVDPAVGLDRDAASGKLALAVQQLDRLIATVPADAVARAQRVLDKVSGRAPAAAAGA